MRIALENQKLNLFCGGSVARTDLHNVSQQEPQPGIRVAAEIVLYRKVMQQRFHDERPSPAVLSANQTLDGLFSIVQERLLTAGMRGSLVGAIMRARALKLRGDAHGAVQ